MPRPNASDPKKPDGQVVIRDFGGFQSNTDPHDTTPGVAIVQVNATSVRPGELRVRQGFRVVNFEG
jgi:hypothetical protein